MKALILIPNHKPPAVWILYGPLVTDNINYAKDFASYGEAAKAFRRIIRRFNEEDRKTAQLIVFP